MIEIDNHMAKTMRKVCPTCEGDDWYTSVDDCDKCGGSSYLFNAEKCSECDGKGEVQTDHMKCPDCEGLGYYDIG